MNTDQNINFPDGIKKCFDNHQQKTQRKPQNLSEFIKEKLPQTNFEEARKVIIAYREYMFYLRGGRDNTSNFCDVCYQVISHEEAAKTTMFDFNYCCNEHAKYRNAFQLDIVRKQLGLKIENLPMIDIYEQW